MTKCRLLRAVLCGLLTLIGVWRLSAQALDPGKPPGGNFNLTNFYLGLPVDGSGGTTGDSASISAALLTGGYSNALYFYTGPEGAMTFWAPVTGATTSGSSYPRSELREQIVPGDNNMNWLPYGNHFLSAQCRVTQVPSTGKVIIGQIHCKTGNARPLLKLQYNNGVVEALVKTNSNFDPDYKFYFQNVGLSNLISYQIRMENGWVTATVNGSNQAINVFLTDPDWATNGLYFKAGSYCQDNVGPTNEGARLAFYALSRSHAPSITNQPTSRTVVAGGNTTFSISATGNGPLRYQWRHYETNNLANSTNAALTLTNIQPGNAGGYSVRVTDTLGALTSAVATLTVLVPPSLATQPTNQLVVAGGSATFTAIAAGSTPLSYQWYFNTNTPLSSATNATLVVSNAGIVDAGMYSVVVTNVAGTATSRVALLSVNRPPTPGNFSGATGQGVSLATPVANLIAEATDPDGDAVALASVNPTSANGGSLGMANSLVWYAPPPGFSGADQWSYTLTDSRGASVGGTAIVAVIEANAIVLNAVSQIMSSDGLFVATFQGVPGLIYSVDCATNLSGPWQLGVTNLKAGTNGVFAIADLVVPPEPQRFYRTHYP